MFLLGDKLISLANKPSVLENISPSPWGLVKIECSEVRAYKKT